MYLQIDITIWNKVSEELEDQDLENNSSLYKTDSTLLFKLSIPLKNYQGYKKDKILKHEFRDASIVLEVLQCVKPSSFSTSSMITTHVILLVIV